MDKRFVAKRDRLRVGDGERVGEIHGGEAYPAADVTPSLLTLGWVSEGVGTLPEDAATHGAFSADELATLGSAPKAKTPAPKTTKPRKAKTPAPK